MKRKRNPERADRENPVWTKETFRARVRRARYCQKYLASKLPPKCSNLVVDLNPVMPVRPFPCVCRPIHWLVGRLQARLANPYGRSANRCPLERILIDPFCRPPTTASETGITGRRELVPVEGLLGAARLAPAGSPAKTPAFNFAWRRSCRTRLAFLSGVRIADD